MIIGSGVAAQTAAEKCAGAGQAVAMVDERPFGGTCALRGCDPKKALRRGAEVIEAARLMQGKGIAADGVSIDWPALAAFKRGFTEGRSEAVEKSLAENGVTLCHGTARFEDRDTLSVAGDRLRAHNFLIATGAAPRIPDIPGAEHLTDSTAFLERETLPNRIVFLGGGYISFEFAHIAARAGCEVHIINHGPHVLKGFDPDLVDRLVARGREAGIAVHLNARPKALEKTAEGYRLLADMAGAETAWDAGLVVLGAGRVPDVARLAPDAAGIETGRRGGVAVTAYLQSTSNQRIYAAGDAAEAKGAPLTPVAGLEGGFAAENMLNGNHAVPNYEGIPSVAFTMPELVRIGLLEAEARETGHTIDVRFTDMSDWYSTRRTGERCAAAKLIIDRERDTLLGAHLLGPDHAEFANVLALAIRLELKTAQLKQFLPAYPTHASDLSSLL